MTLPASFVSALAHDDIPVDLWLEIEGLPNAFGLTWRPGSFFAGRTWDTRPDSILGLMVTVPGGAEQEVRPLDGDSSVGRISVQIADDENGAALALLANSARSDGMASLGAPDRLNSTTYVLHDVIRWSNRPDGSWNTYRCTGAGTTAAVIPPTSNDQATITDGTVTWSLLGPEDLGENDWPLGMAFTGNLAFSGQGPVYIGREAIWIEAWGQGANGGFLYGPTAGSVGRGFHALPGQTLARYPHTKGDLVSSYPRFLATRRARLYATLDGTEAGKVARWAGKIVGAKMLPGLAGVELIMESVESELQVTGFGGQRRAKLAAGLADGAGLYEAQADNEPAFKTDRLAFVRASVAGSGWATGQALMVKSGDEFIGGTLEVSDTEAALLITARGLFSSAAVSHPPGEEVAEVLWTHAFDAGGGPEAALSKFTVGDHPFDVALALLTSRKGDGTNGAWDVLPEGWGIGLDVSRVDTAGITALKAAWLPFARHVWLYTEPFSFKEELARILRPHVCYPVSLLDDVLTIRRLNPPIPGLGVRTVDASGVVDVPTWDANIAEVIGRVIWRCDYDPVGGDYRQTYVGELQGPGVEAQEFYAGQFKTLEVEAQGQWSGNDPGVLGFFGSSLNSAAEDAARRLFDTVRDRYARPFPVLGIECSYDHLTVAPGDLISLTLEHVPDVTAGVRGLSGATCEVLRMTPDDVRGRVTLVVLHTPLTTSARLLGPSAIVTANTAGTAMPVGSSYAVAGTDAAGFRAGDVIELRSADLKTLLWTATVASVGAGVINLQTSQIWSTGNVALLAPYTSQAALRKSLSAFCASASDLLGAADPPHRYAP